MTLLDASIIVERLRTRDPELAHALTVDGAVCGVTRAEILSGARNDADSTQLTTVLNGFRQVAISNEMWDEIGATQARFRRGGLTVPIVDVVVAVVALAYGYEIWTLDAHFIAMQQLLTQLRVRIAP